MRESVLENRLRYKIELIGGKCYKWVSPGKRGVPDRICLMPGGKVYFVEMKAPNGVLSPIQKKRIKELKSLGFIVEVLASEEDVDRFMLFMVCEEL